MRVFRWGLTVFPFSWICFYFVMRETSLDFSDENQADINETVSCTSRFLDDLLDINNIYFEKIINQICPIEF